MAQPSFERSVFINCPFDKDYEPILQAILFCVLYLGYYPRLSTEQSDSFQSRIDKIQDLIRDSKYSIHDLSRCQAVEEGEYFRLNMPFELGMDFGCRQYSGDARGEKRGLVLEEEKYRYQAALSDFSGFDIQHHQGDYREAVRKVRNWFSDEARESVDGAGRILNAYEDFQEWHYNRQLSRGFSEKDIQDYPTSELVEAMKEWMLKEDSE